MNGFTPDDGAERTPSINHDVVKRAAQDLIDRAEKFSMAELHKADMAGVVGLSLAYLDLHAKFTEMNKYMSDCTPLQSDDFSRGESYGADCCARLINDVLDGKTDGVMCEPLGSARQRLIDYIEAERHRVDKLAELVESWAEVTKGSLPTVSQAMTKELITIMKDRT